MASVILSSILRMTDKLVAPLRRSLTGSTSLSNAQDIEKDLGELKSTLRKIEAVLNDAEKQEVKDESVKLWLRELRGVAYDSEDVLDEFNYELLLRKVDAGVHEKIIGKRKQTEVSETVVLTSPLHDPSLRDSMAFRVKEIRQRFEEIDKERDTLCLREEDGLGREERRRRPPTSSFVNQSEIYGREEESSRLVRLLLSDEESSEGNVSVIPVVGMAGVGKTTLTQLAYSDPNVCIHFELRAWVFVSQDVSSARLFAAILESITKTLVHVSDLNSLQESLEKFLQDKRFLIVLDNVWSEEEMLWKTLKSSLHSGAEGSRVIVTTRNQQVAKIAQTMQPLELDCLSDDNCWLIFKQQAFDGLDPDAHPALVMLGKMIVNKCKGLPLAAKALGGLLRYETDEEAWTDILQSDLWDVDEAGDEILPSLRLSYQHLPVHLRRCFLYCSVFPKNYMFRIHQLVGLWTVQGLLEKHRAHDQPEDIGVEYFEELVGRSLLQQKQGIGNEETFVMHDLVHDLARYMAGDECCVTDDVDLRNISAAARHMSVASYGSKEALLFQSADKPLVLRSLLHIHRIPQLFGDVCTWDENLTPTAIPSDCFANLHCLRSLDLSFTAIETLPDSISNLKLLRYLSLRNTRIQKLPESLSKLYYLETLDLEYCINLKELPGGTGNLFNLRHLELPTMDTSFVCMPSGIGRLTQLQELAAINVGADSRHCSIGELKDMVSLGGQLFISGLRNVARGWDAIEADIESKKNLQRLTLDWHVHQPDYKCSHNMNINPSLQSKIDGITTPWMHADEEDAVLKSLRPHNDIAALEIRNYGGNRFPHWMGDQSFAKLVYVRLFMCEKCESLPCLSQLPSLKNLYFSGMSSVRYIGQEFCGTKGFLSLEKLNFDWMPEWEEWDVLQGSFPKLAQLTMSGCPKLKKVPQDLAPAMKELEIGDCNQLTILPTSETLTNLCIGGDCMDEIWTFISNLRELSNLEVNCCNNFLCLPLHNLAALKTLVIDSCSQLESIDCRGDQARVAAAASSSSSAPKDVGLHNLISLECLKIESCPALRFAVDEQLPAGLREVEISCCPMLMEWCIKGEGNEQLNRVQEVIVEDYDPDMFKELGMETEDECMDED